MNELIIQLTIFLVKGYRAVVARLKVIGFELTVPRHSNYIMIASGVPNDGY